MNDIGFTEKEIVEMINDTSKICADDKATTLSSASVASLEADSLTNEVEFWKWMQRNYNKSDIFSDNASMKAYIDQGQGQYGWMEKQMQGKGYEWDWMRQQRADAKNVFNTYDAGDVANRASSDVTEHNVLTGIDKEYQMKAYTGKTNPHLDNTPKDMTVVTNAEKVDVVKGNGYEEVQEFRNTKSIKQSTDKRLEQIEDGTVRTAYSMENIASTMTKAGAVGAVIGMGTEAVFSYRRWKNGDLTDKEYLNEILKSGGDAGVTSSVTAGIMIPIAKTITAMGASSLILIPVGFVVGGVVNKIVAPCFGRGEYRKILGEAKYYQSYNRFYSDLSESIEASSKQYYQFVKTMKNQEMKHEAMKNKSMEMNKELEQLYSNI